MVERQVGEKITRSYDITQPGEHVLISSNKAIIIEDIIISKSVGRTTLFISDGENVNKILYMDQEGVKHFPFNHGLMFWTGASLVVETNGNSLITIGYYLQDGDNYEKWRQHKQ